MNFENPYWLLGLFILLPLAALFILAVRRKLAIKKQLGDKELIEKLMQQYSPSRFRTKFVLLAIAMVFGIISIANMRKAEAGDNGVRAGVDVLVAIDVSKSMLSEDVKPNRLLAAKQFSQTLMEGLGNNRVGLVVFAGEAFLQLPVTADIAAAKLLLSNVEPNMAPLQGTALGNALLLCNNSLNVKEKKFKTVVLISDGEDHDSELSAAIKTLSEAGVVVHTIGIGSAEGTTIKEPGTNMPKVDEEGQTVITKLNEVALRDIAGQTGGTYQHLLEPGATAINVLNSINSMEKTAIAGAGGAKSYFSYYPFILAVCIVLLIAEIFISEKKKAKKIKLAKPVAIPKI